MKQRLLLLITLLPGILLAQQKVIFPDNFSTSLDGKEVTIINQLTITDTRKLNSNGILTLAAERIQSATEENIPGKEMYTQWLNNFPERILSLKTDKTAFYRTGQQVTNLTGTVSVDKGVYTIIPKTCLLYTSDAADEL